MTSVSLFVAALLLLGGCDLVSSVDRVVDGWPIGSEVICAADDSQCGALMRTAIAGFDRRDPGHPQIARASLHSEGTLLDASGNHILTTRSGGCCDVAVFELADGSTRAIGVGYPGVSRTPMAIDTGP